ncbi:MAG: M48 family metallopeptidase [Gammaproteobacteria bacterium]|nr:M48 family metallopeptidase [Gammaproteobacteria bacterium]
MSTVTAIFLLTLAIGLALQLWLSARQAAHIIRHRRDVPAAFAGRISTDEHAKAASYNLARLGVERWDLVLSTALLLAWTLGGGLDWLNAQLELMGMSTLWQGIALVVSVVLIASVVDLPLSIWRTFGIEQRFGFNRTTPAAFVKDRLLGMAITLLLGIPLVAVILWLMDSAGHLWWLWAWLVWMGFTLFVTWAYPIWIAPLFNRFRPLDDHALKGRLEQLLTRCGFRSSGMFVMDGSRRSAHGNAYFTGFGRNKRIVFYDTLLDGLTADEIEAVLAHELGHFKRRHIVKMLSLSALISLVGLALLGWLSRQPWFYHDLGVSEISSATALTLFMFVLPVFTLFLSPFTARLSRRHEFEADDFAAEQTDARHLISGLVKMYRDNASTLTPDPLYSAFYHSHPPASVRVAHLEDRLAVDGA